MNHIASDYPRSTMIPMLTEYLGGRLEKEFVLPASRE
jgi:hypothetical protein